MTTDTTTPPKLTSYSTLIALQEACIARILEMPRYRKDSFFYGTTFLNRYAKPLELLNYRFHIAAAKLGYTCPVLRKLAWKDLCDMAQLQAIAASNQEAAE